MQTNPNPPAMDSEMGRDPEAQPQHQQLANPKVPFMRWLMGLFRDPRFLIPFCLLWALCIGLIIAVLEHKI
jgi:hypothetical protein